MLTFTVLRIFFFLSDFPPFKKLHPESFAGVKQLTLIF